MLSQLGMPIKVLLHCFHKHRLRSVLGHVQSEVALVPQQRHHVQLVEINDLTKKPASKENAARITYRALLLPAILHTPRLFACHCPLARSPGLRDVGVSHPGISFKA